MYCIHQTITVVHYRGSMFVGSARGEHAGGYVHDPTYSRLPSCADNFLFLT